MQHPGSRCPDQRSLKYCAVAALPPPQCQLCKHAVLLIALVIRLVPVRSPRCIQCCADCTISSRVLRRVSRRRHGRALRNMSVRHNAGRSKSESFCKTAT